MVSRIHSRIVISREASEDATSIQKETTNYGSGKCNTRICPSGPGPLLDTRSATAQIRVMTVDGHPLVREGLAAVINREPGMTVTAQAASGKEVIALYREYRPSVVTLPTYRCPTCLEKS